VSHTGCLRKVKDSCWFPPETDKSDGSPDHKHGTSGPVAKKYGETLSRTLGVAISSGKQESY
jgi:hypothetical protein